MVKSIADYLSRLTGDFEIIAVDDGSKDLTGQILNDLKLTYPNLKIIHHQKNKGYGAALISGFKNTQKDFILMMDADRQFDITEISKLFHYAEDFDIVTGYRIKRSDPIYRSFLGWLFNLLTNKIFGINTKDINCGFKLFKGDLIRNMDLISQGALINAEIIFLSQTKGSKIKEVGVWHYPRIYGKQTGASPVVILKAIWGLFSLRAKLPK